LSLLGTSALTVDYGGNRALSSVDLDVPERAITGLIGPNGAGKTTLFNAVSGLLTPSAGTVHFDGRDITRLDPHRRARLGIARTFQRLELFTDLTVRDNLRVAGEMRMTWSPLGRVRAGRDGGASAVARDVDGLVERLGLGAVADVEASEVPTGTARLVELGRALMIRPRLLLLDEPASGQTDDETKAFERVLRDLVDRHGLTVLLIEHDMSLVMGICDHVHVLDFGETIAVGAPDAVRADARVQEAYLGTPT
jgi:branched-chain amino acid transport system ATP-binding protein